MGQRNTSAGTKLHPSPQLCTLLQLFSLLLLLGYIPPALQLTHWRTGVDLTLPVDKLDKTLKPLCGLQELQNINH